MIVLSVPERVLRGIAEHFPIRRTEWISLFPFFGMWFVLRLQPDMFDTSPSFEAINQWGSWWAWHMRLGWTAEELAGLTLLSLGVIRLSALTINGTFHQFRFSPHLRFAASLAGIAFWSQWTLGFLVAFLEGSGAGSPLIAYGTFCLLELANLFVSAEDFGGEMKRVVNRAAEREKGSARD